MENQGEGNRVLTEKQWTRYADVMMWALTKARKTRYKKNDIVLLR